MIPNILHQTWKSKTEMPERFRFWRESFPQLNPDLEIRLYDDADNRALLAETFPQLLELYDIFPKEIFRVDFIRPVYLYKYGGYYADLDFQCLEPLTAINKSRDIVIGRMGTDETYWHSVPNAFMASTPNQAFWVGYLAHCVQWWKGLRDKPDIADRPEFVTGPVVLRANTLLYLHQRKTFKQAIHEFVAECALDLDPEALEYGRLTVLPGHILYPLNWKDQIHRKFIGQMTEEKRLYSIAEAKELFPSSVAATYWTHSWRD